MEVNGIFFDIDDDLIKKALEQAIANVSLEFDEVVDNLEKDLKKGKILVLKG